MKTALLKMDVEPHHYCSKLSRNHLGHFYRSGPRGEIYSLSDANSTYCVKRLLPCFVSRIICMDWTGQRGLCAVVDGLEIQVFAAQQPGGGIAKLQRPLRGCDSPNHARECTFDETGQYLLVASGCGLHSNSSVLNVYNTDNLLLVYTMVCEFDGINSIEVSGCNSFFVLTTGNGGAHVYSIDFSGPHGVWGKERCQLALSFTESRFDHVPYTAVKSPGGWHPHTPLFAMPSFQGSVLIMWQSGEDQLTGDKDYIVAVDSVSYRENMHVAKFAPSGLSLATADSLGNVLVWNFNIDDIQSCRNTALMLLGQVATKE